MKAILLALILLPLTIFAQQKELYPKVVLINAKLDCSGRMTDSAVHYALGRPDSAVRSTAECGTYFDVEDSLAYYMTVVLEKNIDTFALRHIVFGTNSFVFVLFGTVKLNASTTIEDITAAYSVNGNLETNEINDQLSGRQVRLLRLYTDMTLNEYERWNLIFYHNKLIRLELWIAC